MTFASCIRWAALPALALASLTLAGCGASARGAAPCAAAPASAVDLARPDQVLGSVDGGAVYVRDIGEASRERIRDQENESAQRLFHLQWLAVDEAIGERLVAQEAKRRNMTSDELLAAEMSRRVQPIDDDALRSIYEANRDVIGVSFDEAKDILRKQVMRQAQKEAERAFIDELRTGADVRYAIEPPALPRFNVDPGDGPSEGPKSAKATLIVFADFQCPYCARARELVEALHQRYPDSLRIVYRYFPLPQHPEARPAAEAAACAHEQGKFWPYHDLLYAHPHQLESADLEHYAQEVGLDAAAFASCLASDRPQKVVGESIAAGDRAGVRGTPALFLDGIKLVGLLPMPLMQVLIDRELAR